MWHTTSQRFKYKKVINLSSYAVQLVYITQAVAENVSSQYHTHVLSACAGSRQRPRSEPSLQHNPSEQLLLSKGGSGTSWCAWQRRFSWSLRSQWSPWNLWNCWKDGDVGPLGRDGRDGLHGPRGASGRDRRNGDATTITPLSPQQYIPHNYINRSRSFHPSSTFYRHLGQWSCFEYLCAFSWEHLPAVKKETQPLMSLTCATLVRVTQRDLTHCLGYQAEMAEMGRMVHQGKLEEMAL